MNRLGLRQLLVLISLAILSGCVAKELPIERELLIETTDYFMGASGVAVDSKDPSIIYVGDRRGRIAKSIDRGKTWDPLLSATGMPALREPFSPWLLPFHHIAPCYPYRCPFAGCDSRCNYSCAGELEKAILQLGPDNVAAFVGEPVVQGGIAGGVPPEEYYGIVRETCDKYGVLFIADEIITGFGRTGKPFAIEHWDAVPDMIVFGKAASAGYSPLSGVIMRAKIRDSFRGSGDRFAHVFTYVDNPVAMRVGLTVQDILEEEQVIAKAAATGAYLHEQARQRLERHPIVGEIRGKGMLLGIELVRDRGTREPFPASENVHKRMVRLMFERGLSASGTGGAADWKNGDDVRFYPPLITTPAQVDEGLGIVDEALGQIEGELGVAG